MQPTWRHILQQRFYYLRESLLGVWIRTVKQPAQTIPVINSNQEQVIFSGREFRSAQVRKALLGRQQKIDKQRTIEAVSLMLLARQRARTSRDAVTPLATQPTAIDQSNTSVQSEVVWPITQEQDIAQVQEETKQEATQTKTTHSLLDQQASTANSTQSSKHTHWYKNIGTLLSVLLITGGIAIAVIFVVPDVYFRIFPADVISLSGQDGVEVSPTAIPLTPTPTPYIPPIDPSLPEGEWLIIPEIGVKTQPKTTVNPEDALGTGVWQSPDYGKVGDREKPVILAAHRFGWKWWWNSDYWKYNSFYNLPNTKPGTQVELIDGQRKWLYEIYGGEEGDAITDYNADLILYTCKFLNSPIRHVRYARLIDPNVALPSATNSATLKPTTAPSPQTPLGVLIPSTK